MAKADLSSSRVPRSPTVKLSQRFFESLWWVARVDDRSPGDIIEELCSVQVAARRKKHEATIAELVKMDAAEDRLKAKARQSEAG